MATQTATTDTLTKKLTQWLTVRDQGDVLGERQEELRRWLLTQIEQHGKEDERGHFLLTLTTPIRFKTHDGKVRVFRTLKREKHLTPAVPTPDPDKTLRFLKRKGLWFNATDMKLLKAIVKKYPYINISVSPDPDALAKAYYSKVIDTDEYDSLLVEQRESWQFKQLES